MLNPQVAASVTQAGNNIELANPTEFAAFTKREVERYRQIILSAGAGAPGQ